EYGAGRFRKDLYFRLDVVTIRLPALRERRSDIPMLVQWFLDRHAQGASVKVSGAAMKCLLAYDWPGNVRELENALERAVALGDGKVIDVADLPPSLVSLPARPEPEGPAVIEGPVSSTDLADIERATIQRVFEQVNGDKAMARKMLGISRATLYRKLKRYNISVRPALPPTSHRLQ
ncbi:MAG: sigma-54-dependent Fis family transcriptional regulator, partial [Acidobacteria bacterium]|nr:sigma-54-dependent Fis family transcriptional regulator [Acidobacteriota bacterium]